MGLRRASARLLVLALVAGSAVGVTWTRTPVAPAQADVAPASWWSGDCDTTYWTSKARSLGWTGAAAYRLGASYLGIPACGPRPSVDGSPNVLWRKAGWGEYEWQCVELAQRFMAQVYGVQAYQANGNQVVSHYSTADGGGLVRINNGTVGQAPAPGDIISYNSSTNSNGHVAVVTATSIDGSGNGTVTTMEQNYSANGWRSLTVKGWVVQPSGNLTPYGWLHDPQGRGNPGAVLPTSMNLLSNASFELGAANGWVAGTSPTAQTRTGVVGTTASAAREGSKFLRLTSTAAGASTWQVVTASPAVGRSFTFSAWVRSAGTAKVTGKLVLSALGGTVETDSTSFEVGDDWQLVSAPLPITLGGHTGLRAEVVAGSTAAPLDVDGTQLVDAGLTNASFEVSGGWSRWANATSVSAVSMTDAAYAQEGHGWLGVTTSTAGGSIAQQVFAIPQAGHTYTFSAWLRTSGAATVTGRLKLTAVGGTSEVASQPFTVGPEWTLVSVPLSVARTGHKSFLTEVALTTTGTRLDVDTTQLVDSRLYDGSLELGSTSAWAPYGYASALTRNVVTWAAFAREGSRYLALSTTQAGASVRQVVGTVPTPGKTYTFSAWLRSGGSQPVSGTLYVQTIGGTVETGATTYTVGPKWTHISAPLSVTATGHTSLAVILAVSSLRTPVYADATSLVAGDARDADVTPPTLSLSRKPAAKSQTTTAAFAFASTDPDDAAAALTYHCSLDSKAVACGAAPSWAVGQGAHTLTVTATDPVGNSSPPVSYAWTVDSIAPTASLSSPTTLFTLGTTATVSWSGKDVGSGVSGYDVRVRGASYYTGWGAWVQPSSWTGTTATSVTVSGLTNGRTYCYEVRAHDAFGNVSPWSADRCVSKLLDDPDLVHGAGWVQMHSWGFYQSTISGATKQNADLTRPWSQLDRLAVLVTKCASCGSLGVYVGSTQIATINLYAATTQRQVLVTLPPFSYRTGTVVLRSLSTGKTVQVDGLGISRV